MDPAPQPTPLEVYLNSSFVPDADFVDGVIEEPPMGQYDHSSWQHAIELWFGSHAASPSLRSSPPEDTLSRVMSKLEDYVRMGVPSILVIFPKVRNYRFCQGRLEPLNEPSG